MAVFVRHQRTNCCYQQGFLSKNTASASVAGAAPYIPVRKLIYSTPDPQSVFGDGRSWLEAKKKNSSEGIEGRARHEKQEMQRETKWMGEGKRRKGSRERDEKENFGVTWPAAP